MDFNEALEYLEDHRSTDNEYEVAALAVSREKEANWVRVGRRIGQLSKLAILRLESAIDRLREKAEKASRN